MSDAKLAAVELYPAAPPFAAPWGTFDTAVASFDTALVALYHQHAADLVEMLWVFVGDRAEAEDLTQEAFVRLQRAWPRLDHDQNMGGYLRATAFNLARSGFRRRRVRSRHQTPPAPDAASAEDDAMLSDDQEEVLAAVRVLSTRQRQCVVLRYWNDLPDRDIAATLGLSVNSVKTHLRRGLANLEGQLEAKP